MRKQIFSPVLYYYCLDPLIPIIIMNPCSVIACLTISPHLERKATNEIPGKFLNNLINGVSYEIPVELGWLVVFPALYIYIYSSLTILTALSLLAMSSNIFHVNFYTFTSVCIGHLFCPISKSIPTRFYTISQVFYQGINSCVKWKFLHINQLSSNFMFYRLLPGTRTHLI